jgi:hypothetical protein
MSWKIVENAGVTTATPMHPQPSVHEHFPGLVEYAGVTGPAYTFDHYVDAPDVVDWDGREFNNKVERMKQELGVSLPIL